MKPRQEWTPKFSITPLMAQKLMEIEAAKAYFDHHPLPAAAEAELRHQARLRSTHYSTRIEGNRLTLAETANAIEEKRTFRGRERDVKEVQNYWNALIQMERWADSGAPMTEDLVRRLHALVEKGPRAKATPYRKGQNVIRDSRAGTIVYLPPEAKDVPALMASLVGWCRKAEKDHLPVPILAGLAHYQFVTIHPYLDGNGRTARLLATFLLFRGGYGLQGFFSLEEHHAQNLPAYYQALAVHPHHNYYEGRESADLTLWLDYFLLTLSEVFAATREQAVRYPSGQTEEPATLRKLDPRARTVFGLFARQETVSTHQMAQALGLSDRMVRVLISKWVQQDFLCPTSSSRRGRSYALSAIYRKSIGNASATGQRTRK